MASFIYELRQAWVSLKEKPSFIFSVVTTMGICLGVLLCVLSLAYLLLVEPLPYPEQDRLFKVEPTNYGKSGEVMDKLFTYPGLVHLYKKQAVFSQSSLFSYGDDVLTSHVSQPRMSLSYVTPEWFSLIDAPMLMGRAFEQSEAMNSYNPVTVISYETWTKYFASDKNILAKKIDFSGVSFRVIGVLSPLFIEPQLFQYGDNTQLWLPWDYNQVENIKNSWTNVSDALRFVGRLKDEFTSTQAEKMMTSLVDHEWREHINGNDFFDGWNIRIKLHSFKSTILADSSPTVFLLLFGAAGLILIATANILNLFMSRIAERKRTFAIQSAIGANQRDIFKAVFIESILLMFIASVFALVVALFGFYLMQQYLDSLLPRIHELQLNNIILGIIAICAFGLAFVFAKLSARVIDYRLLNLILQTSGKGSGLQVSKSTRQTILGCQVAIAASLLFMSFNLIIYSITSINQPMGFETENISRINLSYSTKNRPPQEEMASIMEEIKKKLISHPQIESVSQSGSPLSAFGGMALTEIVSNSHFEPSRKYVSHDYFEMLNQPLIKGEYFSISDIVENNRVMIINDVFAKRLASFGNVLGMRLTSGKVNTYTVIGVVKGIRVPGLRNIPERVYTPSRSSTSALLLKTNRERSLSREELVKIIGEVDKKISLFRFEPLSERRIKMLFPEITITVAAAALALVSALLCYLGLYGIISYTVQMRHFEICTRLAVGAKRNEIIFLIIKDNVNSTILGLFASFVILFSIYIGFSKELIEFINLQMIYSFIFTFLSISGAVISASYLPLRGIINRSVNSSLRIRG